MNNFQDFWLFRLFLNLAGYGSIMIPAYFYKRHLDNKNYKGILKNYKRTRNASS